MLIQNLALYEDGYCIRVNGENDPLFYYFDYDTRSADINMQFQHFHTFYELCILLSPHATHFLEGKPYELRCFDIMALRPNVLHRTHYPPGDPCRRLIVQFALPREPEGLGTAYEDLMAVFRREVPIFRFEREIQEKLYRRLNDIFLLAQKTDPMRDLSIHVRFLEFLTLLYLEQDRNLYSDETELSPTEKKIYSVTSFIHSHYAEELTLEGLAQRFYISSCYLSRQFKEVTGFTLTAYIQMTRIRNVQSLLMNSRIPITEAASACGFASFSQFNRVFQKHIGMSPSEFRRRNQVLGMP